MAKILRNSLSVSDYEEIWRYIAKDNLSAADRLIGKFEQHLAMLSRMPELGKSEEELFPHLRSFPVGSYLLFYRPIEDGIELVRVLHGARDIDPDYFNG